MHAYHVEGGGGHPDLLRVVGTDSVLTSSTTPTLPLTAATVRELGPMTMTVHRGHPDLPSDRTIAASRIREHAIAAENRLHDEGAISIVNSDALGMGRIGETVRRTWQLAHVQAHLAGETGPDVANNARVLRYLAKLTHNPAVAHGLAGHVGSLRAGRVADIVLWSPAWFGAVPELVIKSGFVAWGAAGSGRARRGSVSPAGCAASTGPAGARPPACPTSSSPPRASTTRPRGPPCRRAALHRDRGQPGPRRRGHAVQHRDAGRRNPRRAGPCPCRRPRGAAAPRRRPAPDPPAPPGVRRAVARVLEIDLLLRDADVLTLDDARPRGRAVAVHQGRVVAVLEDDELPAGVRARRVVSAGGATVVPGFDDAHQHTAWFGQSLAEIPLGGLRDLDAVYDAVAARAAELPPDAFVVGSGYDDVALGGSPDRRALDRAGGGRPVWLKHRSAHVCAVSTEVLARAGVLDGQAAVPAGGVIVRDDAGDPTGVLLEAAQALAGDLLRPYGVADLADAIARATAVFAREGLTHVTEAGIAGGWIGRSPRELAAYQLARERGDLAVRVDLMPETSVLHDVPGGPGRGLDLGLRPGLGDLDLRIGPMKIFFDGALSSRTAAMREPYADRDHAGYLGAEPEVLHDALVEAVTGGWTVAAHAIGDRAVDAALDAFAAAADRPWPGVRPPRHRLEHAGVVDDAALARLAALGVTPIPQARFLYEIGDSMAAAVGDDRADLLYRHASFLHAGLRVPASSDRPCVADGHPLRGIQSMVQRRTATGRVARRRRGRRRRDRAARLHRRRRLDHR